MRYDSPILVTGAAGLIGSAVIWALNRRGHDRILAVDRLNRTEKWRNLAALRFDDYLEADDLKTAVEHDTLDGVRLVLHLGACSSTTETDGGYLIRNNFEYTKLLAEWAVRKNIRFVYASSAATYGGLEGLLSESLDLHSLRPLNMYGYSKQIFDLYAARYGLLNQIVGIKYFNIYGPNEDHKGDMRSVVHKAYHQVIETGKVKLFKSYRPDFADGEQRRDFPYVKDAVDMTLHLAEHPDAHGLFNVGSGRSHTWLDLAQGVFNALDSPANIEFIDMPETLRPKYQYHTEADLSRLRSTGYDTPVTPLGEAIHDYVVTYLKTGKHLGDEG